MGAVYLIYLGVQAWREKGSFRLAVPGEHVRSRVLFWQGCLSNVLNPKVAVFFLAFLPQFVEDRGQAAALQMTVLGLTFAGFSLCVQAGVGVSAGAIGSWVAHRPRATLGLRRLAAGVLIGLGVRLAFVK